MTKLLVFLRKAQGVLRRMKKLVSIFIFLIFSASGVMAQPPAACSMANPPAVFGLRLNMSPEEAQAITSDALKIKFRSNDEKIIFQNYINKTAPKPFTGARALYLRFYERRLYQIEVFYEETPAVKTLEDFTASLSAQWNFPVSDWQREKIKSFVNCGNFSIVAMKILNPKIELTDEPTRAKVEAIRKSKKAK